MKEIIQLLTEILKELQAIRSNLEPRTVKFELDGKSLVSTFTDGNSNDLVGK